MGLVWGALGIYLIPNLKLHKCAYFLRRQTWRIRPLAMISSNTRHLEPLIGREAQDPTQQQIQIGIDCYQFKAPTSGRFLVSQFPPPLRLRR